VIHLDTSFLIRALVRSSKEDTVLRHWLETGEELGMSAIAWTEFLCGPVTESATSLASRVVGEIVAFGPDVAVLAARLFNLSGRRRGTVVDCMIAATAIQADAVLATANREDFVRLETGGLRLVETS
jgi:predicted nucleic acid-binding protein